MVSNSLTPKELEVLALIAQGHDAKSAASELAVSYHTIYERLRRARAKLGVSSSREAARIIFSESHQKFVSENLGLVDAEAATATAVSSSTSTLSAWSIEADRAVNSNPRQSLWSNMFGTLPLRGPDERYVRATRSQRLQLIVNLSARLALTFVAICFAAMIASTLFMRG
jgi:DNA-binding CsgD family transcriptional regulator